MNDFAILQELRDRTTVLSPFDPTIIDGRGLSNIEIPLHFFINSNGVVISANNIEHDDYIELSLLSTIDGYQIKAVINSFNMPPAKDFPQRLITQTHILDAIYNIDHRIGKASSTPEKVDDTIAE